MPAAAEQNPGHATVCKFMLVDTMNSHGMPSIECRKPAAYGLQACMASGRPPDVAGHALQPLLEGGGKAKVADLEDGRL